MSTSDRGLVVEALGLAALVIGAIALVAPGDLWLPDLGLHPAWLPVIVLAARYGLRGLVASLAITGTGLLLASLAVSGSAAGAVTRDHRGADLLALLAAVAVAGIGVLHEARWRRLTGRLADASESEHQAAATVLALHGGLAHLRARHDRVDVALSLWRNLAGRIERGPTADAADAAIELCMIRTGARAGLVELRDGSRISTLAWRGPWASNASRPHDIGGDRTVRAAVEAHAVMLAPSDATDTDSAVAAPVFAPGSGVLIGVIALRGGRAAALGATELRELVVIGQWLAPALARALHRSSATWHATC